MADPSSPSPALWGPTNVPRGEARRWRIGPLQLHVERLAWEWCFHWTSDGGLLDETLELAQPAEVGAVLAPDAPRERFAFGETADPLELSPSMGDRPFVATPDSALWVLPTESARAFVSMPLWIQARVGTARRLTIDVPVVRPQDTWFGSPTAGTLCYASRTSMRLKTDTFATLAHRALVTVELHNRGQTPLSVSRLRIPAPALPLFIDPTGQLRTPPVIYTREKDELAAVDVGSPAPDWTPLAPARSPAQGGRAVAQVFNAFFSRSF